MKTLSFILLAFVVLISCSTKIDSETYSNAKVKGNEITNRTQATLLSNVGQAIQKGGPEYAIEFCNLKASSIIDSLNQDNNCEISRVSNKNRNPKAQLNSAEKELWEVFEKGNLSDTIILSNKNLVYYKPIKTALPACLKCHGSIGPDINQATLQELEKLYPNDLATGYKLNELRGLWKVEFTEE